MSSVRPRRGQLGARSLLVAGVLLGLIASGVLVWQTSRAAFTASTTSPGNAWTAGTVELSDDDSGSAQFAATGITPGQSVTHCIAVAYTGSVASAVTLYATASSGALAPYLNLTVEEGSGGGFGSCTGFAPSSIDYAGTVADFATTRTGWSNGAGFFAPTGAGQNRTYRFTTTLNPTTPNTAQSATAALNLQWQAHNTAITPALGTGDNYAGKLGISDGANRTTLTALPAADWRQIENGQLSSCGIRTNNTLWCAGVNSSGQLGQGDTTNRSSFTQVGTDINWASVSVGAFHACATKTTGTLYCWGENTNGKLGLGDTTQRTTPAQVGSATNWRSIAASGFHTCAIRTDNSLWCWGANSDGRLGVGDNANKYLPYQVSPGTSWISVSAGRFHTCGIRTDRTLWCWGVNNDGALGQGNTTTRNTPTQVGTSAIWSQVGAGYNYTCAVRGDGTLWCWGGNAHGQLGQGDTTGRLSPSQVGTASFWAAISCGYDHVYAARADRSLYAWGNNAYGQLGQGDTTNRSAPTPVAGAAVRTLPTASSTAYSTFVLPWTG